MLKKTIIPSVSHRKGSLPAPPSRLYRGGDSGLSGDRSVDIRGALKAAFQLMREANIPSHTLTAELLLMHLTGRDRAWFYAHCEEPLDHAIANQYFDLIKLRLTGVPTQYLTGKQEFWGLEFEVSPSVLIPRPETEHVVEVTLDRLGHRKNFYGRYSKTGTHTDGQGLILADVGTGSGCIAIALAKELQHAKFYATDISPAALEVARRNAMRHAVHDRIEFLQCNLLDGMAHDSRDSRAANSWRSGCLDVIVSNPPYISKAEKPNLPREVRDHEPEAALFAGENGAAMYTPLIRDAAVRLHTGGFLVLELGHDSLSAVRPLLESSTWTSIAVTNDLAGIPRVLSAERL